MGLDFIVYGLIEGIFQLIIDLANLEIFSQSNINEFSNRIYLILGLVMLFKIIISFVQMLINPDKMDDKEKGMTNILKRVMISLVLIFLVPSIFDIARELQNQVLPIIPKVILGVTIDPDTEDESVAATMASVGQTMSFYSFLPFFNYDNTACDDGSILGTGTSLTDANKAPEIYSVATAWEYVNEKNSCSTNKNQYKYNYRWLISTFVGAYLIFSLVGVAVQIAIRAIKFSICEVIAPIPIASYIDPKMSQQTFDTWVNTSVKTYLDLFINLITVYIVVYVFMAVFKPDNLVTIYSKLGNNALRYTFVTLFIIIGLCYFVKEAPDFFTKLLGVKDSGGLKKIFKGAADVFGTAGGLASVGYRGVRDTMKQSADGGESASLQRTRGAIGGATAAGQFLLNRFKGQKVREARKGALTGQYERNRKSIALTRNFAELDDAGNVVAPGVGTLLTAHSRAHGESVNVRHGGLTEKQILDSRIENMKKVGSAISDGRSSFSSHKLTRAYQQAYEATKARSFDSFVDEERVNIQNDINASQTSLNSIDQRLNDAYTGRINMSAEEMEDLENKKASLMTKLQNLNSDLSNSNRLQERARTLQTNTINSASRAIDDVQKRLFKIALNGEGSVENFLNDRDKELMRTAGLVDSAGNLDFGKVWSDGDLAENTRFNTRNLQTQLNDAMILDSGFTEQLHNMENALKHELNNPDFTIFNANGQIDLSRLNESEAGAVKDRINRMANALGKQSEALQASAISTYNGGNGGSQ